MAGPSTINVEIPEHHVQQELCRTRPPYRQGKKLTAVKVYTVNNESQHLIVAGVPKLNLIDELRRIIIPYGVVKELKSVVDYPSEKFTETFHVRYERIQSARIAKRFLDTKNFYGGILHVFYAPEYESIAETRKKLIQRRKDVSVRIKKQTEEVNNSTSDTFVPREQYHRQKRHPALPLTEGRLLKCYPSQSMTSIYDGIPRTIDPRLVSEPSLPPGEELKKDSEIFYNSHNSAACSSNNDSNTKKNEQNVKRKNYKGQVMHAGLKVKVMRPQILDTKKLVQYNSSTPENKIFSVVKKVDKGITIKLLPKSDENKKRIIIKDASVTQLVKPSEDLQTRITSVKKTIREALQKK